MSAREWLFSFVLAGGLASAHWFSSRVAQLPSNIQKALASLGGGFAISYVFIHLMPELAIGGRQLSSQINMSKYIPSPLIESGLFFTALLGIVVFYSLDVIASSGSSPFKSNFKSFI